MDFNDFRVKIIIRVILIALTIYLFVHLNYHNSFFLTILLALALIVYQIISLINYLDNTNSAIRSFFESVKNNDFSQPYVPKNDGSYFDSLYDEFNLVIQKLTEARSKKDEQYHYLKNIVQHVGIGILTFNREGQIQIINTAAKKLIKVDQIQHIDELYNLSPKLVDSFKSLRTGGRDLVKLERNGDVVQLSVYAIELALQGEEFKLVSLQNIQSELEENEMEAWQKLVRVLTHEIMNSVTPISSLANTVEGEILGYIQSSNNSSDCEIEVEELKDMHMAVQTIQRRSDGLIRFVSDFRNLTHIPKPQFRIVAVKDLLDQIYVLMKHEIEQNKIAYSQIISPENLIINADPELIQQVLINLMKNAIQALQDCENKAIEVNAFQDEKSKTVISVKDNGPGIEEDAQTRIFIPFFTTKKTGSGIGLSLSRQIMRQHLGNISVKSRIDEGSEFILRF
jgi:two-component system, NtrC family, nitrogen regulation sensor histidine kinase NtrY